MDFTWDPAKNTANLEKHGIDFLEAVTIFLAKVYVYRTDRYGEERYTAVGKIGIRYVSVAYTDRQVNGTSVRRIISARRARINERKAYDEA